MVPLSILLLGGDGEVVPINHKYSQVAKNLVPCIKM